MRKALWLQLPRYRIHKTADRRDGELAQYKRARHVARRTQMRAEQERNYHDQVRTWLRLPENKWCQVYLRLENRRVPATQCHHYQGRRGMLLLYQPFWIPVSWEGHQWIEDHRTQARALGLLCPLGRYNSPVRTAEKEPRGW